MRAHIRTVCFKLAGSFSTHTANAANTNEKETVFTNRDGKNEGFVLEM
jgi:hypothetical protein